MDKETREKTEKFLKAWDESGEIKTSLYWRLLSELVCHDEDKGKT